jgi:hypothetical protein
VGTEIRMTRQKRDSRLWALTQLIVAAVIVALYLVVLTRGRIVTGW